MANEQATPPYREALPPRCPPSDAEEIRSDVVVFRLVSAFPPADEDFQSQRAMKPHAKFSVDECFARGLSVWADAGSATNAKKLPALRSKAVCLVRLSSGTGSIMPTFRPAHRTWWPSRDIDILSRCEVAS